MGESKVIQLEDETYDWSLQLLEAADEVRGEIIESFKLVEVEVCVGDEA